MVLRQHRSYLTSLLATYQGPYRDAWERELARVAMQLATIEASSGFGAMPPEPEPPLAHGHAEQASLAKKPRQLAYPIILRWRGGRCWWRPPFGPRQRA